MTDVWWSFEGSLVYEQNGFLVSKLSPALRAFCCTFAMHPYLCSLFLKTAFIGSSETFRDTFFFFLTILKYTFTWWSLLFNCGCFIKAPVRKTMASSACNLTCIHGSLMSLRDCLCDFVHRSAQLMQFFGRIQILYTSENLNGKRRMERIPTVYTSHTHPLIITNPLRWPWKKGNVLGWCVFQLSFLCDVVWNVIACSKQCLKARYVHNIVGSRSF